MACKDCFSGTIHDGTPTGQVQQVHGLPTYVAEAPTSPPKGIIVIISDAFGWDFNNNRILADNYAKKAECQVLLPDFMCGKACDPSAQESVEIIMDKNASMFSKIGAALHGAYHFIPFMLHCRESVCKPLVYNFFRQLRAAHPAATPLGAAGFCWGGKYTTHLCAGWNNPALDPAAASNTFVPATAGSKDRTDELLVDCGFVAHPSRLNLPRDVLTLRRPLSVAHAGKDMVIAPEVMEEVRGVLELSAEGKPECEVVVYEGATHGFAVRWDPKSERQQRQGEEAEEQAVRWFLKHFAAKG